MANLRSRYIGGALAFWDTHRKRIVKAIGGDVFGYEDDFVKSTQNSADTLEGWTVTLTEAGGGDSTITYPDAVGGAVLLTTDAAENDGLSLQLDGESYEITSDQSAVYFGIKFKCDEATQNDVLVGLCITDTDLTGGMTDGIYFEKLDGGTSFSCVTEKDSTETQTDTVGTLAANTDVVLEFYFDGTSVEFFVNGASVATHTTNIPNDESLTPSIELLAGSAAARTMTIDWIRCFQIGR